MSAAPDGTPMKVLVVTGIFPPDIGGPATYVPAISDELVKRGHTVTVVTLSDSLLHDDRSYPFSVQRIRRAIFKPWRFMLVVAGMLRRGRHADVIYVNGLQLEAAVANVFLRRPLVQKIVGDWAWERAANKGWVRDSFDEFQKRRHGVKVELLKVLRRFCARRADALIVPSRYLARAIADWGVAESKIIVVYNAVETPSCSPCAIPLSTPIKVVTVGRLVPWKQMDGLIEALAGCEDAGLVIVGDGPERSRLEALGQARQLTERVYFAGQRTKAETLALMAACDLFVLNSTYEGFPHVVLEAMSAGLPVVATAVGGTPELIHDGQNGILIPPDGNAALAKTLLQLVSSATERQRLAAAAKHTVEQFHHGAMIDQTQAVLRACAALQGGR
jgi:glycosyltransferase involved in cell wall biosynthesis